MPPLSSPSDNAIPTPVPVNSLGGVQPDPQTIYSTLQGMLNGFLARLPFLVAALIVFIIFYFVARGVRTMVKNLNDRTGRNSNIGLVFGRLAYWSLMLIGLMVAMVIAIPNFTPGQLVQLLGISGVAIGFAFKDILQNLLAGILILVTEPFRIGDQIAFKGFEGTVVEIQTRATYLKTYDGRRVVIPNGELYTESVVVNTAFPTRRLEYDIGIGYGDDIKTARDVILQVLKEEPEALDDPAPKVVVVDLADFTVNLRALWWIEPPQQAEILHSRDRILENIKNRLADAGIDLPFPTQQLLLHDQTEATDGDRTQQREGWPVGKNSVPRPRPIGRSAENVHAENVDTD